MVVEAGLADVDGPAGRRAVVVVEVDGRVAGGGERAALAGGRGGAEAGAEVGRRVERAEGAGVAGARVHRVAVGVGRG